MKKLSLLTIGLVFLMSVMAEAQISKEWTIGNDNIKGVTYIGGGSQPQGGFTLEAGAKASLFNVVDVHAFLFDAFFAGGGGYCLVDIAGIYQQTYTSTISKSWSANIINASATFTVGIIPVTVSGSIGVSASISLTFGLQKITLTGSGAGTGTASAAVGVPGWKAGVECECNPIIGGTITADTQGTGTFTLSALHIYLKAFVDYLFGAGHYEYTIAEFGPFFSETYPLW